MAGYTKLFGSIIHSTVWQTPGHVRLVWITMLAMASKDGEVEASVPGLAKAAGVSLAECEQALALLSAPDPYSRSKVREGRRIEAIDGGWWLVNHKEYRDRMEREEALERDAARKRRARAASASVHESPPASGDVHEGPEKSAMSDTQKQTQTQIQTQRGESESDARAREGGSVAPEPEPAPAALEADPVVPGREPLAEAIGEAPRGRRAALRSLLAREYGAAYERRFSVLWAGLSGVGPEIDAVAAWCEGQADPVGAARRVVDGAFATARWASYRFPWKWIAEDPALAAAASTLPVAGAARPVSLAVTHVQDLPPVDESERF